MHGADRDLEIPWQHHARAASKRCTRANAARSQSATAPNVRLPDGCPNSGRTSDRHMRGPLRSWDRQRQCQSIGGIPRRDSGSRKPARRESGSGSEIRTWPWCAWPRCSRPEPSATPSSRTASRDTTCRRCRSADAGARRRVCRRPASTLPPRSWRAVVSATDAAASRRRLLRRARHPPAWPPAAPQPQVRRATPDCQRADRRAAPHPAR